MASLARRSHRSTNIWPGFVDALATLLMVIIFLLMIFVLAQFLLGEAITGRDVALRKLQNQIGEMGELLSLERKSNAEMRFNITQLSDELQASVVTRDNLKSSLSLMAQRSQSAEDRAQDLTIKLNDAFKSIDADKATIEAKVAELVALGSDIAALKALRDDLEKELSGKVAEVDKEKNISESALAQVALVNRQMAALREQLGRLEDSLEESERKAAEQGVQISTLGKRLNSALASKVQELSRYRSEFFGRLREVLGRQQGVRIVGDRFVFQSEVLFESGSAELGEEGKKQIEKLARTLAEIAPQIPEDIDWILRVDGHTDDVPISNWKFPSNWELSAGRAISVIRFLKDAGIPAARLAATGFGEYQPIDPAKDEIAHRRNRRIELKLTQR
ncbi:MAG: peptidoglycan -binding protein [Rhodospirillaceae bacterium]|nr:peptidoglycan -binding protein [Rhodospirillaceae bacterium]